MFQHNGVIEFDKNLFGAFLNINQNKLKKSHGNFFFGLPCFHYKPS